MIKKLLHFATRMDAKLAVVLMLTGLLPLVVAGYLGFHFASETLRQQVMSKLQVVADSKAQRIEDFLRSRVREVTVQSRSPSISYFMERLGVTFHRPGVQSPEYAAAAGEAREYLTRYAQPDYCDNILLIDADGDVVFSLNSTPELGANLRSATGKNPSLARLFDRVGMLLVGEHSDFELDAASGEPKAFVAAPIFKDGVLRGILAFQINDRELFEIATDYIGLGDTGETVIGRREGDSILVMTPTRHDPAAAFHRRIAVGARNGAPMTEATRGNSGIGRAWDYRGVEMLTAWQYLPGLRCGLVVKMDAAEAFAPIRTFSQATVALECLIALLVAALVPLVAHYLAAPIRRLTQTAHEFSLGDLTHRSTIHSNDEIGDLASVFNQMAATIQQQIDSLSRSGRDLEQRVEERTADLEKANLALQKEVAGHQRAEESLRESEERFTTAFELAPIGVALVSPDGHWLKVNGAVCDLVGYSEAELLARTFQDITHPEDLDADLENVRRLLAGEIRTYQMEKRYIHKRGHLVPASLSVSLVRDGQGRPRYFISQIEDITERKQVEESLANSHSLLKATIESTADGLLVVDQAGQIVQFNKKFAELWKIPADILAAHDDNHAIAFVLEQLKDPGAFVAKVQELYAQPELVSFDLLEFKDGRTFERYSQPQRIDGRSVGRVWSFRDITERKEAEAELAYERDLLRALLDNSPDKIYFKDAQSRFIKASQTMARLFGAESPAELVGRTDFDFFDEAHARPAFEDEQEIIRSGVPVIGMMEKEVWRDGREESWVLTNKMPFRNKDGEIIGTFGISKDVTALKRAEAKLADEQARLQFMFESMPVGVAIARRYPDGRLERIVNDAHLRICGLTREQDQIPGIYGKITHPEDAARQAELSRPLGGGAPGQFSLEKRYVRLDGEIVWVVFSFQRRNRDDGSIEELTTVADITELKRAEAALRETSGLLETLLQNATDEIYFKDPQSRFVHFSQSMLRHFCRTDPAEVKGHTDFDFFSEEHARPAYEAEQEVIRTGKAILNLEEKETHIDGRVTWALTSKMPWRDKAGNIIGTMGISRDITERKKIEQALSLTLERLQLAVKAGKAGTWDLELLTGKVDWDDEMLALYGRNAGNVAQGVERWFAAMHPDDLAPITAIYEAALQGEKSSFDTEFRIYRGDDGSLRFIRAMGVVLRDESGRPVRMTGVNWDVTEERVREKKLAEALAQEKELSEKAQAGSRAKSEFLAVMSHEIRTPMNGILGFSELLATAPNLPGDCRDYVKTIASSGEALLRIIDDILDFSRLEAGGLKIEPTLFSSRQILQDIHTLLTPRAKEKQLDFFLAVDDGIPEHLWNDAGRLRQILINLVGNALKFTARGSVTLGMRPSRAPLENGEAAVDFFVRDTGTGIPADKIAHVFEPFAQADSSISRRYGGTGLGLAISRNLVELMGGVLTVRSKVGEGSEFSVSLPTGMPLGAEPAVMDSARNGQDETFAKSHPLRILIGEDDPVNRKLLLLMLRKLGYEPLIARDGAEVVDVYRREHPDCILMDLQMPRKGGLQATSEIRQLERVTPGGGHAYIAALTADIVAEDRRLCFDVGMDAHMNKPIKRALLAKILEQASAAKAGA